ncbi:MAG: choice-of-anchor D domain-containing protein, partial [Kofleriaceae bacterium]
MTARAWLGFAIAIAEITATAAIAGPTPAAVRATPGVRVVEVTVPGGGNSTLSLINDGGSAVTVDGLVRDASCDPAVTASAGGVPFTIAAGGMKSITIACATSIPASIKRCVFHAVDTNEAPVVDFEGVCRYGAASLLTPNPALLGYGDVVIGASADLELQVTNDGATPIERLFLHIDDLEGNFRFAAPCNPNVRACDPATAPIAQGASIALAVQCTPQSAGAHAAKLYVVADNGQHLTGSPSAVDLTCNGIATSAPTISITPNPVVVQPTDVIGSPVTSIVHIGNVGGAPLTVTSINIIDAGNGASADWTYDATGACFGAITPGSACMLEPAERVDLAVGFNPSAIGRRDATMLISFNDSAPRSVSLALRGEGRGSTVELIGAPAIDFGRVPINAMPQATFALANRGNQDIAGVELAIAPAAGTPFTLAPPSMTSIVAGSATTITATCKPTSTGQETATFEVASDDAFDSAPISIAAVCEGSTLPLIANPTTIRRGEIRTGSTPAPTTITLTSSASTQMITSIALETQSPALSLTGAQTPVSTPHSVQLHVATTADAELDNAIVVTTAGGDELRIPIAGTVRTAELDEPLPTSLGTFCVNQPTTPRTIALGSTGTATVRLVSAELELGSASPFDLLPASPSHYPSTLKPQQVATVELTPRRQATPGLQTDELVWTT